MFDPAKRNTRAETSQYEDGLAVLASMLADMLVEADGHGSGDTPDDSQDEVKGSNSLLNLRASTGKSTAEYDSHNG